MKRTISRTLFLLIISLLIFNRCGNSNSTSFQTSEMPSSERTLLTSDNFEFLGAFRLPTSGGVTSRFGYGGFAMTLNPKGDPTGETDGFPGSLYIVGHDHDQWVAEVSIPLPLPFKTQGLQGLNQGRFLQPFADITQGMRASLDQGNGAKIGGLAYLEAQAGQTEDKIYWTAFQYYDVEGANNLSHGWANLDLSNPNAKGMWRLGNFHSQMTAGYIFSVPKYFADEFLKGKRLISGLNIAQGVSYSSAGPALFAYAPWQGFENSSPPPGTSLDTISLTYYKHVYPESSTFPDYQIPDGWHGGAWVTTPTSHTVIITGSRAMGPTFYGLPRPGDCSPYKGYHGDPFEPRILFYDPNELAAVARGEKEPWEIIPYLEWNPSEFIFPTCEGLLFDASYDQKNQLLYILHRNADLTSGEPAPLIYVFKIN